MMNKILFIIINLILILNFVFSIQQPQDIIKTLTTAKGLSSKNNDIIYNFSNKTIWEPNSIPNLTDNIVIESGINIVLDSSASINSLRLLKNSTILIKNKLKITNGLYTEYGSNLLFDSYSIDKGTTIMGGDVNIYGSIYISSYFSIYTYGRLNILGEMHLGGLCYINSESLFTGYQYGLYGSMFIFTNNTTFNNNFMVADTTLTDFLGDNCIYQMVNGSISTLIHSISNILTTTFKMSDSGIVLIESVMLIDKSNITMGNDSMLNFRNSYLEVLDSNFIKSNSTIVFEHDSNSTMINSNLKFYNQSQILLYNGSFVEFTGGNMVLFDSYLDIFNDSELIINGEYENFKIYNQSSVEISHLGRCYIFGQLNLHDKSSLKCKKGGELYINGTLVHYENSFINSTQGLVNLNGDVILKDKSFFQSDRSTININGNLSLENKTSLKIKNSTFIVPGSIYLKSSILLLNSFLLIKGSFISNNEYPSNFTNSILNITGEIHLNGVLSFNDTFIQTNSKFSVQGDIIGFNLNVTTFGHFIVNKNASFLCNNCNFEIGKDSEFIYDEFSIIKFNNTKIKINSHGVVKSFGTIQIIHGTSILNTGTFEHSSNIFQTLTNNSNNNTSILSTIQNNGNWKCLINLKSDINLIELPFINDGGNLIIDGSKTEFKLFNQDNGNINLLNKGSIISKNEMVLKNGGLIGNGTVVGNITSINGSIGESFKANSLNINGDLQFHSNISKLIITINSDRSFTIINVNQSISLLKGGQYEILFLIDQDFIDDGEFEFLTFNSILNDTNINATSTHEYNNIKFNTFNAKTLETKQETDQTLNGCNRSIKKTSRSMALMLSGCTNNNKKSISLYTYVFSSVGVVFALVIVSICIQKRNLIKTKYLLYKDRYRESKYNNNKRV